MRTTYSAWYEQALRKLSLSQMLLLLHICGHLVPKHRPCLPPTSKVVYPCSRYSYHHPSFQLQRWTPLPSCHCLLNNHFFHGASQHWPHPGPYLLSAGQHLSHYLSSPHPAGPGWGWAGGRALCLQPRQLELSLTGAQGKEHTGLAGCEVPWVGHHPTLWMEKTALPS